MITEKKSGNGLLDDFSLDDGDEFFGIKTEVEPNNIIEKIKAKDDEDDEEEDKVQSLETNKVKKPKTKKEEDDEEDEDFVFGETDKNEKSKTEKPKPKETEDEGANAVEGKDKNKNKDKAEDPKEDEEDEDEFFTNLAIDLKEKGILSNVEIPEGKVLTEEEFFKIQDDELESRVTETFEALFEELGEEGSNFLKFVKSGGNPRAFLTQVSKRFSLDELDTNNENQVNKTLSHYFTTFEKTDEEDIADKIKWLEDSGKKKAYATKYFKIIKDTEKEQEQSLLEAQELAAENKRKEAKEFNDSLKDVVSKTEAVGSVPINKKEHKELIDYITRPTVKVGKNNFVPEFNNKLSKILRGKTDKDKQQLLAIAKICKEDFNLPDLDKAVETRVITRTKSKIAEKRNNTARNITSGIMKRSLADEMS